MMGSDASSTPLEGQRCVIDAPLGPGGACGSGEAGERGVGGVAGVGERGVGGVAGAGERLAAPGAVLTAVQQRYQADKS